MTLEIAQSSKFVDEHKWTWSVWIDGSDEELALVKVVEYALHPTFDEPVRRIDVRATKFRLDECGSGEFEINAHVFRDNGTKEHLKHWLELPGPGGLRAPAKDATTVFVAYAAADAEWGQAIRSAFVENGVRTVDVDDMLDPDKPWQASIAEAIEGADLVVGLFSDATSPSVLREVTLALTSNVPVVPIVIGADAEVPESLAPIRRLALDEYADLTTAIGSLIDSSGSVRADLSISPPSTFE